MKMTHLLEWVIFILGDIRAGDGSLFSFLPDMFLYLPNSPKQFAL
jgi:hypothetical protein